MAPTSPLTPPAPPVQVPGLGRDVLVAVARAVTGVVMPDGGQRTARRNAWAGMSEDAQRSRARREADLAVQASVVRHARSARTG